MQAFIEETDDIDRNKALMEKETAKPKDEGTVQVLPEGWGKAMSNADDFKPVAFTLKKKRTHEEMLASHGEKPEQDSEKRRKIEVA